MENIWLWIFLASSLLLVLIILRSRLGWKWVPALALNIVIAALLLYLSGLAEPYTHVHIPINAVTIATVTVLGIPGVMLLAALQFAVL
jgi:inhibitor of the pro-sigma K processing machinery